MIAMSFHCVHSAPVRLNPVLQDDFESGALSSGWQVSSGAGPVVDGSSLRLRDGAIWRDLAETISDDFELTFDALHTGSQSLIWVAILNASGKQGYSVSWDSASASNWGGNGFLRVSKIDVASAASLTTYYCGSPLPNPSEMGSSHAYSQTPPARVTLSWNRKEGKLRVFMDGAFVGEKEDFSFNEFSRIYVGGGRDGSSANGGLIDNLLVRSIQPVPLPGTVFQDSFTYKDPGLLGSIWVHHSGTMPTLSKGALLLHNGVAASQLAEPLTYDVEIAFDLKHAGFQKIAWVGMLSGDGNSGYAVSWDSSGTTPSGPMWGGKGIVRIHKINQQTPISFDLYGSMVVGGVSAGNQLITDSEPAHFRVCWSVDSRRIDVYMNGSLLHSGVDSSFSSFQRIVVGGSEGDVVDNVRVRIPVGAELPFETCEAEDTAHPELVKRLEDPTVSSPAREASGRSYVHLGNVGDYVDIPVSSTANTAVLRVCVPDAPVGSSATYTLTLQKIVDGVAQSLQSSPLVISPKHAWQYANASTPNDYDGMSNDASPDRKPCVFWDEVRVRFGEELAPGTKLRLKKSQGDTAEYYLVDLVDLELATPLGSPAEPFLSVSDFGASGSDSADDTMAIQQCLDAASMYTPKRVVWIPAGRYYQRQPFTVPAGVKVRGAGPWFTEVLGDQVDPPNDWSGTMGFKLDTDVEVSDLFVESLTRTGRSMGSNAFDGGKGKTGWKVNNVWISHTLTGFWVQGTGQVRNCRVRFTYADGITIAHSANGVLIENNHVRGCGDDGIAILSHRTHAGDTRTENCALRRNTVSAIWWGMNGDLGGGKGHSVEYNYLVDNALFPGLGINQPASEDFGMFALENSVVRRNLVLRGGGFARGTPLSGQWGSAFWILAGNSNNGLFGSEAIHAAINNVTISDNRVLDATYKGVQIQGGAPQYAVSFLRNIIRETGDFGVLIEPGSVGQSILFERNSATGIPEGKSVFLNASPTTYAAEHYNNSWN